MLKGTIREQDMSRLGGCAKDGERDGLAVL